MKTLFKVHYSKIVFISIIAMFCSLTTKWTKLCKRVFKETNRYSNKRYCLFVCQP